MASPSDYWSFFLLVEELSLRSLWRALASPGFGNPLYVGLSTVVLLYLCEFVRPWRRGQRKLREGFWLDVCHTLFNLMLFLGLIGVAVLRTAELLLHHALGALGLPLGEWIHLEGLPLWSRWLLLFLFVDFLSYWGHRLLHRSELLWTFHQVHHSSRQLDALNAVRLHWVEKLFYPLFSYVPTLLVGFGVTEVLPVLFVRLLLSNFTHANLRVPLGPFRYVVNNPQLHIWHHARAVDARRNVNYGDALSVWDYLFGTAHLPDDRSELELGFDGVEEFPSTFLSQQAHPLGVALRRLRRRRLAPTTRRHARLARAALLAALVAGVLVSASDPERRERVVAALRGGHRAQASALLAEGRPVAALGALERASSVDAERLATLQRLAQRNRAVGYQSRPMSELHRSLSRQFGLRVAVGEALLARRGDARDPDGGEDALLERALANARLLVGLEPRRVEPHYLLGATHLLRARALGSADELQAAVSELEQALAIDPSHAGARRALGWAKKAGTP